MYVSVSVVIPFYNASHTLQRALASIMSQTQLPREVIVVDDRSTDAERSALLRLASRVWPLPVRTVLLEQNGGPAVARNRGWEQAQSMWIAFLDADDAWHPQRLELQLLSVSPSTLFIGATSAVLDPQVPAIPILTDRQDVRPVKTRDLLLRNLFPTSSVLVRTDAPDRFTEGRSFAEDHELWIRLSTVGDALRIEAPLSLYFKFPYGEGGLSGRISSMIRGEFATFDLLRRDGTISLADWMLSVTFLTARVARRILLLAIRRSLPIRRR